MADFTAHTYLVYEESDAPPAVVVAPTAETALARYANGTSGHLSLLTPQSDGSLNAVLTGGASPLARSFGTSYRPHSVAAVLAPLALL